MLSLIRAGVAAALLAVALLAAHAAEKAFQNSDLADSAIKLEAQIKSDAGAPVKPVAQIRRDADAASAGWAENPAVLKEVHQHVATQRVGGGVEGAAPVDPGDLLDERVVGAL